MGLEAQVETRAGACGGGPEEEGLEVWADALRLRLQGVIVAVPGEFGTGPF